MILEVHDPTERSVQTQHVNGLEGAILVVGSCDGTTGSIMDNDGVKCPQFVSTIPQDELPLTFVTLSFFSDFCVLWILFHLIYPWPCLHHGKALKVGLWLPLPLGRPIHGPPCVFEGAVAVQRGRHGKSLHLSFQVANTSVLVTLGHCLQLGEP